MLDLHGAMVTESPEDGEGRSSTAARDRPGTPIAVSLDMHANLYDEIVANATVIAGYQTYPHIDTYETARLAGESSSHDPRRGEAGHGVGQCADAAACHAAGHRRPSEQGIAAPLRRNEQEGALAASLFTGFSHADIRDAGLSAVVVTDGDRQLAEDLRDELLDRAWVEREAFVYDIEPLQQSVARAKAMRRPNPARGRSCCSITTTIAPRAARWTRPRAGGDCGRGSRMSPPLRSTIRKPSQAIAAGVGAEVACRSAARSRCRRSRRTARP